LIVTALRRRVESGVGSVMTRIHGDFHLGQVLVASGDVHIIDFEGEPARPLKERRAKASPLRDVAGLLRSLDYAAATLVPKTVAASPLPDEARREFILRLRDGARDAFLTAYRAATVALPGLDNGDLLDFFLIEKAAYEVAYEAASRPAWLPIPMHALADLATRIAGKSSRRTQ
jgi:maltose alpha-D-glucosyltransferase/alpha-amylase